MEKRTSDRAVFNGLQALSVLAAVAVTVFGVIGLNELVKQSLPDVRLAHTLSIWWSIGSILVDWKRKDIAWPSAVRFDFVGGLRVCKIVWLWPRFMRLR